MKKTIHVSQHPVLFVADGTPSRAEMIGPMRVIYTTREAVRMYRKIFGIKSDDVTSS
jgi:hypothetical protein